MFSFALRSTVLSLRVHRPIQCEPIANEPLRKVYASNCGGDAREAVKALLVANEFLERELETQVSRGYMRGVKHGRFNTYSG